MDEEFAHATILARGSGSLGWAGHLPMRKTEGTNYYGDSF